MEWVPMWILRRFPWPLNLRECLPVPPRYSQPHSLVSFFESIYAWNYLVYLVVCLFTNSSVITRHEILKLKIYVVPRNTNLKVFRKNGVVGPTFKKFISENKMETLKTAQGGLQPMSYGEAVGGALCNIRQTTAAPDVLKSYAETRGGWRASEVCTHIQFAYCHVAQFSWWSFLHSIVSHKWHHA